MNYLAHIFLSFNQPKILVGNFVGDMIRPKEMKELHPDIIKGIELHRKIDAFTDNHIYIKNAIQLIKPSQGKYAPVVVDIYGDYFLSKFWKEFTKKDFNEFKHKSYDMILNSLDEMPERIQPRIQSMVKYDWLVQYESERGLHHVFERVSRKAKFNNSFLSATKDLMKNEEELGTIFLEFLPELIDFSRKELKV